VVPGEICVKYLERGNRYRKITLNTQKSAEAIVAVGPKGHTGEGPNQQES